MLPVGDEAMRVNGLATVLLVILHQALAVTAICPDPELIKPCECSTRADELQIWCSQSDLESILIGLKAVSTHLNSPVDELILENNAIPSLPGRAFSALKAVRLMLRDNKLERVASNWLGGLEEDLLEVFIVEPTLRSLPEDSLENLPNLEAVTLQSEVLPRLPSLNNLSRLRYLHTQLPMLSELSPMKLRGLVSLEQVRIAGSPQLSGLDAATFMDMTRLMSIDLSDCGINWIHARAMTRLPSLKELLLINNRISDAGVVGRSIRDLPVLGVINLEGNQIDVIKEASFVDIPPLREIYLNRNSIREIQRGAFHRLPSLRRLDLGDNQIARLHPEFFLQPYDSGLEELSLINNQLDDVMHLRLILDVLPRLRFLDMSFNKLQDISFGSMRGHNTLERLHLDHNLLTRVVREAFSGMPALRELRLRNNSLSNYLEMPLWNLPNLKGLDLSNNRFIRLDRRVLANLPSLRRLDVSENRLSVVDPASFLGTPELEHVNLSHNSIESVGPQTFPHLSKLFELDMGSNRLRTVVPGLPRALEHLHLPRNQLIALPRPSSPDFMLPSLRTLDVTGNGIHRLPPESFMAMPMLSKLYFGENALQSVEDRAFEGLNRLEELDLHGNRIQSIQEGSFRKLDRLHELSLNANRLEQIQPGLFKDNVALEKLDLSRNYLSDVMTSAFEANMELRELSLSHNSLKSFPSAILKLPQLRALDISHNRIQKLQPLNNLKSLSYLKLAKNKLNTLLEGTFQDLQNLTSLDLESNEIEFIMPHVIRSIPSLQAVHLSRNKLSSVPSSAFTDLPSLVKVDLQENQLTHLASDSFTAVPNLLMLNLSYNQIGGLDHVGLNGLKSLEILDLSHNRISHFSSPGIPQMSSLVHLKLDNNRICNIYGSPFSKMSHLRYLSLRNNKLTSLPESTFEPVRSSMYQLDIEGNPLQCSCGILWVQGWIQDSRSPGPRCSDGTYLKEYRLSRQNCIESKQVTLAPGCEDHPAGIVGLTQHGSPLGDKKHPSHKPTPEESDYFYDEYIEYEVNETSPFNFTQFSNQLAVTTPSTTTTTASSAKNTVPPEVLSHYIPGDTPTLYAGGKPDEGKNFKPTQAPSTTFTFFGMPLPSLNIGSFWGSGRNSDGKGRFAGAKGRVQQLPGPPHIEKGGFTPMLPGRGGFRPMFNPFNDSDRDPYMPTMQPPSDVTSGSMPQATIIKVPPQPNELSPLEVNQIAHLTSMTDERNSVNQDSSTSKYMEINLQQNNVDSIQETTTPLILTAQDEIYPATLSVGDYHPTMEATFQVDETDKTTQSVPVNRGPASLSGFLAPGGDLTPYVGKMGRPIITKVMMSPPSPVAEEIQDPTTKMPTLPPDNYEFREHTRPKYNNSVAWYYKNYNNTNLEPYVGPTSHSRSSATSQRLHFTIFLLCYCFLFNY